MRSAGFFPARWRGWPAIGVAGGSVRLGGGQSVRARRGGWRTAFGRCDPAALRWGRRRRLHFGCWCRCSSTAARGGTHRGSRAPSAAGGQIGNFGKCAGQGAFRCLAEGALPEGALPEGASAEWALAEWALHSRAGLVDGGERDRRKVSRELDGLRRSLGDPRLG